MKEGRVIGERAREVADADRPTAELPEHLSAGRLFSDRTGWLSGLLAIGVHGHRSTPSTNWPSSTSVLFPIFSWTSPITGISTLVRMIQLQHSTSGVWRSHYWYPSGKEEREGEHYVVVRQHGDHLVAQSLPHSEQSQLNLDMMFQPPTATGTVERTSPTGRYKGAHYHGSIQLMVDPSGRAMTGKWVGFGRSFDVNSGQWTLTWVDGDTTEAALREYHLKV